MKANGLIELGKGDCFSESRERVDVFCVKGRLWLTQPGDGRDVVLSAGERFHSDPSLGKLVAEALEDSSVVVTKPLS